MKKNILALVVFMIVAAFHGPTLPPDPWDEGTSLVVVK